MVLKMKMVPKKIFQNIFLVLVTGLFLFPSSSWTQNQEITISDTLLEKFSIEELVKLKKMLEQERQRILQKREQDLERGIQISKDFLNQTREENEKQDYILIRVAEYYIDEADNQYEAAVEEYNRQYAEFEKQMKLYEEGKLKVQPQEPTYPRKDYTKAIAVYDLILTNFPESEMADDALYNKAYLLKQMGEEKASQQVFLELLDKFPESKYAPEAYMQLAEYYFQARLNQSREETIRNLHKAAQLYKNVLRYKDSPRYDEALYKLGWTYYRLAADNPDYYRDAITYFTMVIQDIERLKDLDPEGKYVRSNIEPEAIQYLAASFVDTSFNKQGVEKPKQFIERLGKPNWGVDVFAHMGDLYARIVDYPNSILAYRTLLEMYPDYAYAPRIRKKIADVYLEANQPEKAFEERQILFESYNPKSDWYARMEESDRPDRIAVLDSALTLSEEALRANIIYQLSLAQKMEHTGQDTTEAYNKFVDLCKQYLETFPTHENAYEINWSLAYVLDTKLHRYKEAFEEYLRVSNDYLEDAHREDAANNAIAVAQTLVEMKRASVDTTQIAGMDMAQMTAQELTEEEKMLAEAFDNYIKLFPNGEKTASYLASAGALYYQHRQFDLARKYYKTMVSRFPEAQQKSIGLISLMNSYFFLGKYKDAEFVARKILESEGVPEDQKEVARKRIGESIYKNAERLEQEEKYVEAAKEYFRVYTDAKYYSEIVDLALFNSGRNYEKAEEWQQAIAVYDTLVVNFPESKYRLIALGRIADDYKQMEDFANVAATYERIYKLYPDHKDAEVALYNASLFYAKAQDWQDAIRVNETYITKYPDKPDSKDLLFENARYYLKLGNLAAANKIYDEFAQRYPNDSRSVEAFYRRGEYFFENGQYDLARQEFMKAINKSNEYARTGKDPNLYFASEAYYKLGEIEYQEYKAIQLGYPESQFRQQVQLKKEKLKAVIDAFSKVIQMGSLRGFEAMYKIAEAYEDFADAIVNQQLPPNLTPEQELVERDRIFKASVPAYERAVEEYKNVIKNIPIYAEKLEISLFDTTETVVDTTAETPEDSLANLKKEMLVDSTRDVALRWYHRAEEKVSSILYGVAKRSEQFIDAYLRQKSPGEGVVYLSWKKVLLEKAVAPAIRVTLQAHLKNIQISSELGLKNKYVEESKRKILLTSKLLADEYGKLVYKAADIYEQEIPVLIDLVEGGETATTPDGMNSLDYNDQMMSVIDYMNEFLTKAINQYEKTLEFAQKNNIENDAVLTTQDHLFNRAYEASMRMLDLSQIAEEKRDYFNTLSDSTGLQKYQLGAVYFDDQRSSLRDYARQGLESGYEISKKFGIDKNVWVTLILAKLVELKPAKYLGDLPREKFVVESDTSWLASTEYDMNWLETNFADGNWKHAVEVTIPADLYFAVFDSLGIDPPSIWVWTPRAVPPQSPAVPDSAAGQDTTGMDTTGVDTTTGDTTSTRRSLELMDKEPMDVAATNPAGLDTSLMAQSDTLEPDTLTAYFRKHFILRDQVVNGWAVITADDEYHIYLNGEYIKGDETAMFESVDHVSYIEISDFLHKGENIIAVDVTDFDGPPRYGLRFYMVLELLPVEVTSAAEKIRQAAAENIDENQLMKIIVLNKNRIIAH